MNVNIILPIHVSALDVIFPFIISYQHQYGTEHRYVVVSSGGSY
jgi:hypothetical protein